MTYHGRRVLIIGGTGFVGGRLAERLLLECGALVRVPIRDWRKAVWISRTAAELVAGDVTDFDSMVAAIRGCEIVFHCASGPADQGGYMRTNRDGTANVIAACKQEGVRRLVYVSSVAVHGARPGLKLSSETPLLISGRDYSDSKIAAEALVQDSHASGDLETVVIRPTYVWGPRSNAFTIRQIREMASDRFRYVDNGEAIANAVYIDNLVDALIAAGVSPDANGKCFLVTDGIDYQWRDLFEKYAEYVGADKLASVSSRSLVARVGCRMVDHAEATLDRLQGQRSLPVRAFRRLAKICRDRLRQRFVDSWELNKFSCDESADIEDAKRVLSYAPKFNLETGIAETIRWLDDQLQFDLSQRRIRD